MLIDLSQEAVGNSVALVSADAAASSTPTAADALTSEVAYPAAAVGPAAAPAAGITAAVSVAAVLTNDQFDLSLPDAATGSASISRRSCSSCAA
jgi:hypothetical protein